jgi:molybdate-binding protein
MHVHIAILAVKAIINTYSECVSEALVTQHAHMGCVMSSVASLGLLHFSTLSQKEYDFWKKINEYNTCVVIFSTTYV